MTSNLSKPDSRIDLKPAFDRSDPPIQPLKVPFFKAGSHRRRADTWIVSLFVILHIVVFVATMLVNDCSRNSHGDCVLKAFGRVSFQPMFENPLLGPSASALDKMGALQRTFLAEFRQTWRVLTCASLHAGVIHLILNLGSVIYIGIHLEQEFGPLRIGLIYLLSAYFGSLMAALFVRNRPAVCSSSALFGLLGAMLSGLIRNWKYYSNKSAAITMLFIFVLVHFIIGLLPFVDNFSNFGGFLSGFLLGFVVLFSPQIHADGQSKGGLPDHGPKRAMKFKKMLDRPILRSVSLLLFILLLVGLLVAVFLGVNMSKYCNWCHYLDCLPSRMWSCNDIVSSCETRVSNSEYMTMTCMANGNFRIFPFDNVSHERLEDLCSLVCS